MLVNQSLTTATLSLFRPQPTAADQPAKISTEPLRMAKTADMSGFYSAPTVTTVQEPVLSEQTQKVLDTIASLVANEGAAINRGTKAIWSSQLGRDIPLDTKYDDLSIEDQMSMDGDARRANHLSEEFRITAYLAGADETPLKGITYFGQKMDMSREELIEDTINRAVDSQVNNMRSLFAMAADPEVQALMTDLEIPTDVPEWTDELEQTVRADLTAKRWAEFERGEMEMTVTIYSSTHAANYGEAYKVLDMRTGEMTVNEANRTEFNEAWELSDSRKANYAKWLDSPLADQMTSSWGEHRDAIMRDVYA